MSIAVLHDTAAPLDARIRAMYALKNEGKTLATAQAFAAAVDLTDSILLQHELLYNLGQFQIADAALVAYLKDIITAPATGASSGGSPYRYNVVSRHEALESLGAIFANPAKGTAEERAELVAFLAAVEKGDAAQEIRESAELAVRRLTQTPAAAEGEGAAGTELVCASRHHPYVSVDPAPAFDPEATDAVLAGYKLPAKAAELAARTTDLGAILRDPQRTLWDRYRAMFSLRNIGTAAAVAELCRALDEDSSSALFRHEVAFVLGQMEHPASATALEAAIRREGEHPMVRHEAAEAVGALAEPGGMALLEEFAAHPEPVLRDSCIVAVEMHKYWSQYKAPAQS